MQSTDEEDLRLLYQVTVGDLAYFKTQQWQVSNYALLLEAAIVGVAQLLEDSIDRLDRILLSTLAIAVAAAALLVIHKLQRSIAVRDARLTAVRDTMGQSFRRAWAAAQKSDAGISTVNLLRGGIVAASLLTLWLVACRIGVAQLCVAADRAGIKCTAAGDQRSASISVGAPAC